MPQWAILIAVVLLLNMAVFVSRWQTERSFWTALHSGRALTIQAASMTAIFVLNVLFSWQRYEIARIDLGKKVPLKLLPVVDSWLKPAFSLYEAFVMIGFGVIMLLFYSFSGAVDRYFNEETGNPPIPRKWASMAKDTPTWGYLGWVILCLLIGIVSILTLFFFYAQADERPVKGFILSVVLPTIVSVTGLGVILALVILKRYGTLGMIRQWVRGIPRAED